MTLTRTAMLIGASLAVAAPIGGSAIAAPAPVASSACTPRAKADCTGLKARGMNLRGRNLKGANLTRADLRRADLRGANLSGATLTRANLDGAMLDGANFSRARILSAKITGVSAVGANWSHATFGRAPGARKGRTGAAEMAASYFSTTVSGNHCGGNFAWADISFAVFSGDYSAATCPKAATFFAAQIYESGFSGVNFQGVNANAVMIMVDFTGALLQGTDMYAAGGSGLILASAQFGTEPLNGRVTVFPQLSSFPNSVCPNNRQGTLTSTGCVNT